MVVWWGKLLGALFGWVFAGSIGCWLGLLIGHFFDRGLQKQWMWHFGSRALSEAQRVFFKVTFTVMGHIAKVDGRVSEQEIAYAEFVIRRMGLSPRMREQAIIHFREGKSTHFNLNQTLQALKEACQHEPVLLQMFVNVQFEAAHVEGNLSQAKQQLLKQIYQGLGVSSANFQQAYQKNQNYRAYQQHQQSAYQAPPRRDELQTAYETLGVSKSATMVEIKKAYKRLMSRHHPDKLVARGLPPEMIKLATEKTQEIKAAYDKICGARA